MILLLAMACGVAVGNVYFPQAVIGSIATGLHVSPGSAAIVVAATQIGYTLGIFFLVPLGDRVRHRTLIVTLLLLTGLGLLAAAAAPNLTVLTGAGTLIGATTVVAPIIGPMAAGLVPRDQHGATSGTLLSGSLGGMLLSRAFGGPLSQWLGWRAGYAIAGVITVMMALVLLCKLPAPRPSMAPSAAHRYPRLLAQSLAVLRTEPELRRSCVYQASLFAGFTATWTGVALLLTGPVYHLGATAVGMLALVNAGTMIATPLAGRYADRHGPGIVNLLSMTGVILAAFLLAGGLAGGVLGLAALVAGSLLLDVAMQSGMVANQVRNYALRPRARSRVNTAYMTCAYCGGAAGSWLGARSFAHFGWLGVCGLTFLLASAVLIYHVRYAIAARQAAKPVEIRRCPATVTALTGPSQVASCRIGRSQPS
jgi:predicted MFS family arabinose efflux permease